MKTKRLAYARFLAGVLATAAFGLCVLGSVVGAGCSSPQKEGGEGAQCTVFTDCAGGLFCVPVGSQMICSADAAALVMIEEAGAASKTEAAAPSGDGSSGTTGGGTDGSMGGSPGDDANTRADASGTPGVPEASATPAVDDAASAPVEAAPPTPDDAGEEP